MKNTNEFKKFANKHLRIPSTTVDSTLNYINNSCEAYLTPMILEERKLNVTQLSVFDRLLFDRILWVSGGVDDRMCDIIQAQLMYLDSVNNKTITMHLNSPGGSVLHGLNIISVMDYVKSPIATINVGMCASMASVILSAGEKGFRSSLIHGKVMIHQVSHSTHGNIQETRINQLEAEKYNYILFKNIAKNCGKEFDEVINMSRRDKWLNSDESLQFGIIDEIIGLEKNETVTSMLEGFEDYYNKEVLGK